MMKYGKYAGVSLVVFALAGLIGCANALPEYAGKMDIVKLKMKERSDLWGAEINMEDNDRGGIVGMANKATGAAAAVKLKKKFQKNIDPKKVNPLMEKKIHEAFSSGNPFKTVPEDSKEKLDGKMRIWVTSYGMEQEGSTPEFFVNYQTRIWYNHPDKDEMEVVFKWPFDCDGDKLFEAEGESSLAGTAAFLSYVNKMSDKMFKQQVYSGFERCAHKLARTLIRKSK